MSSPPFNHSTPPSALGQQSRDFEQACANRFDGGRRIARAEVETLVCLANRVGKDLAGWSDAAAQLDLSLARSFDRRRAAVLVLESVFDDLLTPEAWRVLAAALEQDPS
jgi:hypothetical protein